MHTNFLLVNIIRLNFFTTEAHVYPSMVISTAFWIIHSSDILKAGLMGDLLDAIADNFEVQEKDIKDKTIRITLRERLPPKRQIKDFEPAYKR